MSALHEFRHIMRDIAVWVTWFLLTLKPTHGRTYGELRRLGPRELAIHVAPMAFVVGVALHFHLNMPAGAKWFLAVSGGMGLVLGGTLVVSTVVISRLVDISFTYR